jgi:predicted polyphosphate/ATP-dependent NAD kinase
MRKVGLIVNPIAGMGGRVGLKGTDGDILDTARALGAVPQAGHKAARALRRLAASVEEFELLTCPGEMGAAAAESAGLSGFGVVEVEGGPETGDVLDGAPAEDGPTGPAHTKSAAREMLRRGVDLLLFAGGDGTARDIAEIVGLEVPTLGIPAGVKIYSGVFATSPENAGNVAARFVAAGTSSLREAEVVDVDEEAMRQGRLSVSLFGSMHVPVAVQMVAGPKTGGAGDVEAVASAARDVARSMEPGCLYIIGPGTTTQSVARHLGLDGTLLGVDAILDNQFVGTDLSEQQILTLLDEAESRGSGESAPARIIVGVIGGQGYIFGRGNQQIGPKVIRRVGKDHIVVVCTASKLMSLTRGVLLVDTGDPELDRELQGFRRVVVGVDQETLFRVGA